MALLVSPSLTDDLKRLAEAATPGPWTVKERVYDDEVLFDSIGPLTAVDSDEGFGAISAQFPADAAYIAAASPDRILALLAEITYREASFEALAAEYTTLGHERDALLAVAEAARAHLRADAGPTYSWVAEHEAAVKQENHRQEARADLRAALARLDALRGEK